MANVFSIVTTVVKKSFVCDAKKREKVIKTLVSVAKTLLHAGYRSHFAGLSRIQLGICSCSSQKLSKSLKNVSYS